MTFLAPFIAPILAAIRWLAITAGPWLLAHAVSKILIAFGVGMVSFVAVMVSFNALLDIAIEQVNVMSSGVSGPAVQMMALFGVFEALSLIVSAYLAKVSWMLVTPRLTLFNPPAVN